MEQAKDVPPALGLAVRRALESGESPMRVGAAYESLLEQVPGRNRASARKSRGVYFTPDWLVQLVLDLALDPLLECIDERRLLNLQILDPACGSGAFLVAVVERMARRLVELRGCLGSEEALAAARREVGDRCVYGMDQDEVSVGICRAALAELGSSAGAGHIVCGDGLLDNPPLPEFDAVLGNPPFLNRLEKATARDAATSARLRASFGPAARAYTDVSSLFLLRAVRMTRAGGRVALVLPQSVLGARDAAGVRQEVSARAAMTDVWLADDHAFSASVFVCVPVFRIGGDQRSVRRLVGEGLERAPDAVPDERWSALAAVDVPELHPLCAGTIGDVAEVTADFRDEYYGLTGSIVDVAEEAGLARVVTTGLIGLGECLWGRRPCRLGGRRWAAPRVEVSGLEEWMRDWARARQRPKVLLATQTRILEAAIDEEGRWLPVTPLISVVPPRRSDLWLIGAILCSPVLTALAARLTAGTGLARGAIKLSASQVRGLPLPAKDCAKAAGLFRKAVRAGESGRPALLMESSRAVCDAYGLSGAKAEELMAWWSAGAFRNA